MSKLITNKTKRIAIAMFLVFMFFSLVNTFSANAELVGVEKKYIGETYENQKKYPGEKLPYRLLLPQKYDKSKKYPLVLYLTGAGQNGSDNEKQLKGDSIPTLLALDENQEKYPCFVLAPQCDEGKNWVDNFNGDISAALGLTMDLLDELAEKYSIDPNKIYVTGISTGGTAVWDVMFRFPDKFAAGIPMASHTMASKAEIIKKMPIWVFHSTGDAAIPVEQIRKMVDSLKALGSDVKYSEYGDDIDHGVWWYAFSDKDFLPWIFAQDKSQLGNPQVGKNPGSIDPNDNNESNPSSETDTSKGGIIEKGEDQVKYITEFIKNNLIVTLIVALVVINGAVVAGMVIYKKKKMKKDDDEN